MSNPTHESVIKFFGNNDVDELNNGSSYKLPFFFIYATNIYYYPARL